MAVGRLLALFAPLSVMESAWGMQRAVSQAGQPPTEARALHKATVAEKGSKGGKGGKNSPPDIQSNLEVVNKTLDDAVGIIGDANTTAKNMLETVQEGIGAIIKGLDTANKAVGIVSALPEGDAIAAQLVSFIDSVNKSLTKVAEQLPSGMEKAVKQLTDLVPKLTKMADDTYSAFMAAQSAMQALEDAAKEAKAEAETELEDDAKSSGGACGKGDTTCLKAQAALLELRAGSHARRGAAAMDRSLMQKGKSCDECCKADASISVAKKNADLFKDTIKDMNATITDALMQFVELSQKNLEDINATVGKALADAGSTDIPSSALKDVGKALDEVLQTPLEEMVQKSLADISPDIDKAAEKLKDGLKDILKELGEYYEQMCDTDEDSSDDEKSEKKDK